MHCELEGQANSTRLLVCREKNRLLVRAGFLQNASQREALDGRKGADELQGDPVDTEEGEGEDTAGENERVRVDSCKGNVQNQSTTTTWRAFLFSAYLCR